MLKIQNAITCEYVTIGSHNKHILVNTYAGDILVREFPARFPLAFYFEFYSTLSGPLKLKFEVQVNRNGIAGIEFEMQPTSKSGNPHVIVLPQIALTFESNSELKVVAKAKGRKSKELISKKVSVGAIPD